MTPSHLDAPVTAMEAVARVQALVTARQGVYGLGCGDYRPEHGDNPYTASPHGAAADCRVVVLHGWKLQAHRYGFNRKWTLSPEPQFLGGNSVADDINYNSIIESGLFTTDGLFQTLPDTAVPQPGDLLAYPTIHIVGADGEHHEFVGHGAMIDTVPAHYQPGGGWHQLFIMQCRGPNGRGPAVIRTDGGVFDRHTRNWQKPQHRARLVRPLERK